MTPTDPTTLRTALEALVGLVDCYGLDHYGGDWGCAECHPDSDMLVAGFQCGLHLARAALATPAPAADEARRCWCGHLKNRHTPDTCCTCDGLDGPYTGSCNGFREQCGWCGRTADHEPVPGVCGGPDEPAPAPTPAPPTPPATEERVMPDGASFAWHSEEHGPDVICGGCADHIGWHMEQCRCEQRPWCVPHPADGVHQWASLCRLPHEHVAHPTPPATERCAECAGQGLICLAGCPPPMDDRCPRCHGTGTPPATEPVAALVSELVGDLRLSELGRDGRLDIVARKLDAIVAAARTEVDVERLARALHDQGFGCNAYRCSLGRGSSADAHEQDARFLADAYRETADDR